MREIMNFLMFVLVVVVHTMYLPFLIIISVVALPIKLLTGKDITESKPINKFITPLNLAFKKLNQML